MKQRIFTVNVVLFILGIFVTKLAFALSYSSLEAILNNLAFSELKGQKADLNPRVFKLGVKAYSCAVKKGLEQKPILTIIDYSKPSSEPRMWVINLAKKKVEYQELVAHGRNTGNLYAENFSNKDGSKKTSIGVYKTGSTYIGHNGYSLRLLGLEQKYNSNALERTIVIHGADYVSPAFVDKYGRLGRSWGCPSLSRKMSKPTINAIKNGTLVFAYYPDSSWLKNSSFLHC